MIPAQGAAQRIKDEIGPIDVLVNNAGVTRDMTFRKMTKPDWDAVIRTNLDSVFNMTKQVCDGDIRAFFDANVLYPSGLRNFLMHRVHAGRQFA